MLGTEKNIFSCKSRADPRTYGTSSPRFRFPGGERVWLPANANIRRAERVRSTAKADSRRARPFDPRAKPYIRKAERVSPAFPNPAIDMAVLTQGRYRQFLVRDHGLPRRRQEAIAERNRDSNPLADLHPYYI